MRISITRADLKRFLTDYGMVFALLLLCVYFSFATWGEQYPEGKRAARQVCKAVRDDCGAGARVLVVAHEGQQAKEFVDSAVDGLKAGGIDVIAVVSGEPSDLRTEVERLSRSDEKPVAIVATRSAAQWRLVQSLSEQFPAMKGVKIVSPRSYSWPVFLKGSNLLGIVDHIVVIAIIAIGMTMVIITAGIDLSVGSLIALSAVVSTLLIRDLAGGKEASGLGMALCFLAAIAVCGMVGGFSGLMVTAFSIPPFIVTLSMMLVASGLAFILAAGQSIYEVPASIDWLGRGSTLPWVPNTVALMVILYVAAHVLMTRTVLGRYIYAVGGNIEAARLSGVPVRRVILSVYAACGALAGLGGVVQVSVLRSGAPTYGQGYELDVIAAVVVGGTSLSGGQGKILGTLIGAFIIAVIRNGMNLTGVESYAQKVVLGLVILGAVLIDMLKKRGWGPLRLLKKLRKKADE